MKVILRICLDRRINLVFEDKINNESKIDPNIEQRKPSHDKSFLSLETAIKWLENLEECDGLSFLC